MTARRDNGMADPRGADGWAPPTLGPRAMPVYRLVWSALFLVALVIGNLLWLAVLEEGTDLHRMLDYVCRAAGPALRVEAVSIAVAGEQGRWTIGACHGPVAAGAERWIAGHPSLDDRTTIVDRADALFSLRIPPHRPPRWREAHDRLDAGRPPPRWHDPDKGVIGLLEDIAPAIGHAILAIEARNGRMAALRASLLREPA